MNYSGLSVHIDLAIIGHSGFFGHFKMCSTPLSSSDNASMMHVIIYQT